MAISKLNPLADIYCMCKFNEPIDSDYAKIDFAQIYACRKNIWIGRHDNSTQRRRGHRSTIVTSQCQLKKRPCLAAMAKWRSVMSLNKLLLLVRQFENDFHLWRSHSWKSLPIRLTGDRMVIYSNAYLFLHLNSIPIVIVLVSITIWIGNAYAVVT